MSAPNDWRDVVLAMGDEPDVTQEDNLVVSGNFLKGSLQIFSWILEIPCKPLLVCAYNACRRTHEAFTARVVARPPDKGADRLFGLLASRSRYKRGALGGIPPQLHDLFIHCGPSSRVTDSARREL